jgi:hypothetical protein
MRLAGTCPSNSAAVVAPLRSMSSRVICCTGSAVSMSVRRMLLPVTLMLMRGGASSAAC